MTAARAARAPGGRVLGALLGWITTIALVGGALEGILRLCGFRPIVTINEPDRDLGWVKRRSETTRKVTSEYDVTFSINSLGLRGDESLTRAKPAGARRVLFLGDSFVLGYTVDPGDHFVDLVGSALRRDRPDVETLNGGTEGYSTDQEVLWLEKEGFALGPDVVVACFFQNDVFGNGQSSFGGVPKPRFAPDGRLEPAPEVVPPRRGWLPTRTAIGALPETIALALADRFTPDEAVLLRDPPAERAIPDCWARTEACLRRLKQSCESAGAKLLFVAIPAREEIEPGALERWCATAGIAKERIDPTSPAQRALAMAAGLGIATLDPSPAMKEAARAGDPLYFAKDWHVNPAGSRALGRAIWAELCEPRFLGGGATAAGEQVFAAPAGGAGPMPRWPFVIGAVWLVLSTLYALSYRDESRPLAFVKVGALIALVVGIVLGFGWLIEALGPTAGRWAALVLVGGFVGWLLWKMLPKLSIMREVHASFVRHGKWYMLPLIVVMLSIGGLLVVASSSPFIAPFIYTLF